MSRRGSRTSRRSICSIPTARAPSQRPRPNAGNKGEPIGTLDGVPVTIKDNIATKGQPVPLGAASVKLVPAAEGCAARRALARSRRGDLRQDHHAGLRHAVVGPLQLPSAHPQSLGPQQESRRLQRRRGRRGRGRLRPAASRHRHRRLGAAAGRLVRPRGAEAEPRARSDRSALCRPRRRPDDPHRRRCRADDERAVEARPARRHEPAARTRSTGRRWRNRRANCASA